MADKETKKYKPKKLKDLFLANREKITTVPSKKLKDLFSANRKKIKTLPSKKLKEIFSVNRKKKEYPIIGSDY